MKMEDVKTLSPNDLKSPAELLSSIKNCLHKTRAINEDDAQYM